MYQFAWIKHQSVHFLQSYKGFVVLISLFPLITFENVWCWSWSVLPMFLESSTIFLLHLELKHKNSFKLKTGFDFRQWSVSVRLTFWLQLYVEEEDIWEEAKKQVGWRSPSLLQESLRKDVSRVLPDKRYTTKLGPGYVITLRRAYDQRSPKKQLQKEEIVFRWNVSAKMHTSSWSGWKRGRGRNLRGSKKQVGWRSPSLLQERGCVQSSSRQKTHNKTWSWVCEADHPPSRLPHVSEGFYKHYNEFLILRKTSTEKCEIPVPEVPWHRVSAFMPSSLLASDGSTDPISPFPCGLREASLWRQEAAVRFSYRFTGSVASTIWEVLQIWKKNC